MLSLAGALLGTWFGFVGPVAGLDRTWMDWEAGVIRHRRHLPPIDGLVCNVPRDRVEAAPLIARLELALALQSLRVSGDRRVFDVAALDG